jgi:hypothetical protein
VVSIRSKFVVVWVTMWQPEQPILVNAWNPAVIDAADAVEVLLDAADDEVEVEDVEDPAAIGRTEAIVTVVVEPAVDVEVMEVLVDAGVEVMDEELLDAVDDVVKGIAGAGGASRLMNNAKLIVSGLLSDTVLPLLIVSTVLTVSSGRGLGAHCGLAVVVAGAVKLRLSGNSWLLTPSSTL